MSILNTRIIHTHDVEENWNKCTDFIPRAGELIIYDPDKTISYTRFKIGDGVKSITELDFTTEKFISTLFNINDNTVILDGGRIGGNNEQ